MILIQGWFDNRFALNQKRPFYNPMVLINLQGPYLSTVGCSDEDAAHRIPLLFQLQGNIPSRDTKGTIGCTRTRTKLLLLHRVRSIMYDLESIRQNTLPCNCRSSRNCCKC
ncbi:unnamed protein product [Citrullus colocynthis]|uniref:Uncharacterized protein n=1 Tax=Citrullus colocynthis TaxID=252529 RepID=A0ABP0XXP5_9ROSI